MIDTLTFSLVYIALGYLVVGTVWIITTPTKRLCMLGFPATRALQVALNLLHILSGLFFPLALPFDIPIRSLGLTFLTVGVIFAVWAKLTMKESWGVPGQHDEIIQNKLVIEGPFSFSRNPIYLGIILMCFGMAIALKSVFVFFVLILYVYLLKHIQQEEKMLVKHFGADYREYRAQVPRFI
ncbi:MAG TPA: isoprenylcysteine carboxylmethyltransferase family protein [Candidatus Woesebacteria bacterium]|nr:isoprenylcysteine carboxylmethyltransferase family protein [Candidatus Woesebacteria bacterium]HNS94393.1 isoprenylcysteine carboxylmethyltransferase family protein [Candidatus Woesebacteria bacterium]